jgi:hypothetical protein
LCKPNIFNKFNQSITNNRIDRSSKSLWWTDICVSTSCTCGICRKLKSYKLENWLLSNLQHDDSYFDPAYTHSYLKQDFRMCLWSNVSLWPIRTMDRMKKCLSFYSFLATYLIKRKWCGHIKIQNIWVKIADLDMVRMKTLGTLNMKNSDYKS